MRRFSSVTSVVNRRLLRSVLMSSTATGTDFTVFYFLTRLDVPSHVAAGAGCAAGAVIGFTLGYRWAFEPAIGVARSAIRYVCVSTASAVAVIAAMAICSRWVKASPTWSWCLVRALVYLAITFPLFRFWAFDSRIHTSVVNENTE